MPSDKHNHAVWHHQSSDHRYRVNANQHLYLHNLHEMRCHPGFLAFELSGYTPGPHPYHPRKLELA